ncbi:MAG: T9SS type A sorting domain-containing protein, partial [bacterium]|nr:T9SS type A sorting domain-containing protein [bacterium]
SIQFLDNLTGYSLGNGNHGIIYKTTNGGTDWNLIHDFNPAGIFRDMSFVNQDTGWVCSFDSFDGGVFKTIDGGNSWQHQLNYTSENPKSIFFVTKEVGWVTNNYRKLYKTSNGGENWNLQLLHTNDLGSVYFINENTGWLGSSRILKTTNSGVNWISSASNVVGGKLDFISDSVGWGGVNFFIISKTTDGGNSWFYQNSPIVNNTSISAVNNLKAWAGGTGIVHTTDGGGLSNISEDENEISEYFTLNQNYPNPFNPSTFISYTLGTRQFGVSSFIKLKVFNINGKEIQELVNQRQNAGEYKIEFDASHLTSGIYFYMLEFIDDKSNKVYRKTKKMIFLK